MKSLLLCLALAGCATVYPLPSDPAVQFEPNDLAAWINADAFASESGGDVYRVTSGSMVPTLLVNDYVVAVDKPWSEYQPRKIAFYEAEWAAWALTIHRIVGRDSDGLVMSGDANEFSEARYRVTEGRAKGLLVGIWRAQKL